MNEHYESSIYVATFPAGTVRLELRLVPLHALTEKDHAFLNELIDRVEALGASPPPDTGETP